MSDGTIGPRGSSGPSSGSVIRGTGCEYQNAWSSATPPEPGPEQAASASSTACFSLETWNLLSASSIPLASANRPFPPLAPASLPAAGAAAGALPRASAIIVASRHAVIVSICASPEPKPETHDGEDDRDSLLLEPIPPALGAHVCGRVRQSGCRVPRPHACTAGPSTPLETARPPPMHPGFSRLLHLNDRWLKVTKAGSAE
mmetsp:Transcript_1391/g.4572  ORF Transcript_1391/g.4572 Transcript_1391/m.4572 type:complete len:202 (-) Transcript_1391:276-881(-)